MRTAMQITERVVGGVTILDLTGAITIDQDAGRLKDKINSLIQQARTSVVLNLAEVSAYRQRRPRSTRRVLREPCEDGRRIETAAPHEEEPRSAVNHPTRDALSDIRDGGRRGRSFETVPLERSLPLR